MTLPVAYRDCQGIVFIDDGDYSHVEQFDEGILCI